MNRSSCFICGIIATMLCTSVLVAVSEPLAVGASADAGDHVCVPMDPEKVETGKLGETIYHFQVGDTDTIEIIPPDNFDFLSATADELQELGIPKRSSDPDLAEAWTARMSHATAAPPGLCAPDDGLPPATVVTGGIYGGVEASNDPGHPYVGAEADNRVFINTAGCNSSGRGETSWVGVQTSDASNPGLLQNGVYRWSGRNSDAPAIFYESIYHHSGGLTTDEQPMFPSGFTVTQGELLYYDMDYTTSSHYVAYFWQHANGGYETIGINLNTSRKYWDGTRTDFIDEKFAAYDLQPYGSIGWAHAWVHGTGPGDAPGNLPHFFWEVVNNHVDENLDYGLVTSEN